MSAGAFLLYCTKCLVHSTHAAHAGVGGGCGFGFLDVAEDALGGEEHAGDRGGVLQGHTGHLGGVDDAALEQVLVLLGAGVVAVVGLAVLHFVDDDAAVILLEIAILTFVSIKNSSIHFFIPLIHICSCIKQYIPFSFIVPETMTNFVMMLPKKLNLCI